MCLFKCIAGILSENTLAVNVLPSSKNSWNQQTSNFILFFHYPDQNCVLKNLFLIRSEILGLLLNTWSANYEYSGRNRENLPLEIQTKFSKNSQCVCGICFQFLKFSLNFQCSEKKHESHSSNISEIFDPEKCAYLNA